MAHAHYACSTDFLYVGWGEGEKIATGIRVLSTMITLSILSSWCTKDNISRLLLFFIHWLSGLVQLLAKTAQGEMMRFCGMRSNLVVIVKSIKFLELVSSNMLAFTNLAICINLALIIYSHRRVTRVRNFASSKLIMVFLALSVLMTASAVPFWDAVVVSGAHVWVYSPTPGRNEWSIANQFSLEFASGFVMMIIVLFLVVYRRPELQEAWQLHRRIQFYFGLTLIAILANLGFGIAGTVVVVREYESILMMFAYSCGNTHIALDTIVLYHGLGTTWFNIEGSSTGTLEDADNHADGRPAIDASGSHSGTHPPSGEKSSADETSPRDRIISSYVS